MKSMTATILKDTREAVKRMLHCHRDSLRNIGVDTLRVSFQCTEGFYGEAFGIMRCLRMLGYGDFGAVNVPGTERGFKQDEQNLSWWLHNLENEVLEEEGFRSNHECPWCRKHWGKDDSMLIKQGKLSKCK